MLLSLVTHFGFTLRYVQDLPRSVRSVTDLRNRRIYLERQQLGMHTPRTILLQTLGHIALGHAVPKDFADFLRQRVEANYYAAATLLPERTVVPYLQEAKADRELSIEDLCDVFSVSYEMAAHRFTNLATHHLELPVHFAKNDESGTIYKAYANDGLSSPPTSTAPSRASGCAGSGPDGTCSRPIDRFSVYYQYTDTPTGHVLVPLPRRPQPRARVRDHARRAVRALPVVPRPGDQPTGSSRPAPTATAASVPPAELAQRWQGYAWPSARAHSHVLAVLPPGAFPGVDESDVYDVPRPARFGMTLRWCDVDETAAKPRRGSMGGVAHRKGTGLLPQVEDMAARPHELRRGLAGRQAARGEGRHDGERRAARTRRARDGRRDRRRDPPRPRRAVRRWSTRCS